MVKQAPSFGRILTMVLFALSCFGLLLFLWISFGGTVPLKPQGYRVQVSFPEATQLGLEADVRVAGVSIGNVREKALDEDRSRTLATLEIDPEFAPLNKDARAILRQKTLLGETYVELTPGSEKAGKIPEGGRLENSRVADSVQLDEIFQALDPDTRASFRTWQQELGKALDGRGRDLNDAIGNLPGFVADAGDVLEVLDSQEGAVQRLIKNTGVVFGALTEQEGALRALVQNAGDTFAATASQNEALADAISIFPTFLDESKTTLARLQTFSKDTHPLIKDLEPASRRLPAALRDARILAPDLEETFTRLRPLIEASDEGLPALRDILTQLEPSLKELGPFLQQLNPILRWLELNQTGVADFITNGSAALADTVYSQSGGIGHYLRQFGPIGMEALGIFPTRGINRNHRGNTYFNPLGLDPKFNALNKIFPNFDCFGGEQDANLTSPFPAGRSPACKEQQPLTLNGKKQGRFPKLEADGD